MELIKAGQHESSFDWKPDSPHLTLPPAKSGDPPAEPDDPNFSSLNPNEQKNGGGKEPDMD